ncbi:methionine ABC transporter ATP-binding protein [Gellertiella hungarica]|nr:ATP-binding cassette domain-containing protein [Gellertiella hungarica]
MDKTIAGQPLAGPETAPAVAEIRGVTRTFGSARALDSISLTVRKGEILGLIGRSGAGKSTLIRCLNGLERPDSGSIRIEGQEITDLSDRALQPLRRRIGMVFQHFNLLSAKTVIDNVALPLKIAGVAPAERRRRALELLDLVGLAARADAYPSALSGGQKQRVGIARALSANPALLLSDEATSALDPETTHSILDLIRDINRNLGLTVLLITHEMDVVRSIAGRVAVIDRGRIVEEGAVADVFARPVHAVTQSLLAGIRPQLPAFLLGRLGVNGTGPAVFSVDAVGADAGRDFARLFGETLGAPVHLVHGGIDHIGDQPVGRFFFRAEADRLAILARAESLGPAIHVEFLGHEPGSR